MSSIYSRFGKRVLDVTMSAVLLILLAVPMLLIALLIVMDSRGKVFFTQERLGRHGRPFRIYKFRTMKEGSELQLTGYQVVRDDPRITRVGKYLRLLSLDELPQLFNVFWGQMSLVGPRPALVRDIERYTDEQRRRLQVKPGMTGLAQVSGRTSRKWPERIAYDIQYVDQLSLVNDLRIILRTFSVLLDSKHVYHPQGQGW